MATKDDELYSGAYNALLNAQKTKNQADINNARNAIGALKGTGGEHGIGEFSKQLDTVQQGLANTQVQGNQNTLQPPTAYNPQSDIEKLKEAQRQQAIAALNKSRDSALSNLGAEKAQIQPMYYNKRNETSTGSQLQAKNFAEYMANRGLTNSGTNAQAEIARNVSLQGNIGALNQQEAAANADIARRETDVRNAYESDLAAANAGIEANALNQLINANQRSYELGLNQYNTDRGFNYQQEQDKVRNDFNQNQFNFQKEQAAIDNAYRNGQLSLQQAQFEMAKAEQAFNQKQVELENAFREKQFEWSKYMDGQNLSLAKTRASSGGSSGSSYPKMTTAQKVNAKESYATAIDNAIANADYDKVKAMVYNDKDNIINELGESYWKSIEKKLWDWQAY